MAKHKINFIIIAVLIFIFPFKIYAQDLNADNEGENLNLNPEQVKLNADRVSFNDETGQALAEGKAVLQYGDATIQAERIEYDASSQKVKALALPNEQVTLSYGNKYVKADQLDYDLISQEGILSGPHTRLAVGEGVLYVYGKEINVIPWDLAEERGLVKGAAADYLARWSEVTLTTCTLEHPHYKLVAKSVSFVPGKKVIAKKPRIYLGNLYLFSSPFDYVVELKRRAVSYSIWPYFQHSDKRGTGGGLRISAGWQTGKAALDIAYATESKFEWAFEIEQQLNENFTIAGGFEHSWDDLWDNKVWRPFAALRYNKNNWRAELLYRKNQYISDQKDSTHKFKGRLDRKPEFTVWSPWYRTSQNLWLTFFATHGTYLEKLLNDTGSLTNRFGFGAHGYFETITDDNGTELFSDNTASLWLYDRDKREQRMFRTFSGFRYKTGNVQWGSAFERIYSWGQSSMKWDEYRDRKRFHQKVRFQIGPEFFVYMRGSYDISEHFADEIFYGIQWVTDCMTWDLYYKNDRTYDDDDKIGLTLSINAFPEKDATLGQNQDKDPFLPPDDLPKK